MTAVRLTPAQARTLGVTRRHTVDAAVPAGEAPGAARATSRAAPAPYHTVCHDCAEQFRTRAAEDRHLDTTRHLRYATVFTVTTADDDGS